jgi:hypothetical protein
MLVVLLLLPLSLAVDNSEFNHGGGGSGSSRGGGSGGQQLVAKAAGNESVGGCTMVCNDKSVWQTTTQ